MPDYKIKSAREVQLEAEVKRLRIAMGEALAIIEEHSARTYQDHPTTQRIHSTLNDAYLFVA